MCIRVCLHSCASYRIRPAVRPDTGERRPPQPGGTRRLALRLALLWVTELSITRSALTGESCWGAFEAASQTLFSFLSCSDRLCDCPWRASRSLRWEEWGNRRSSWIPSRRAAGREGPQPGSITGAFLCLFKCTARMVIVVVIDYSCYWCHFIILVGENLISWV